MTRWTTELDAKVRAMRAYGLSAAEIGRKLGFSKNAVIGRLDRLRRKGMCPPKKIGRPPGPVKGSQVDRVIAFNKANPTATARQISEATGIPGNRVRKIISLHRIAVGKAKDTSGRIRAAAWLKDHPGATAQEIADATGLTKKTVHNFGLPLRRAPARRKNSNVIKFRAEGCAARNAGAGVPPPPAPAPKLRVITNVPLAVADFIAKGRVRRFEDGDGSDYYSLQSFLRQRGYELVCVSGLYRFNSEPRRTFGKGDRGWREVIAFVDRIRIREGMQPILVRSA